MRLARFIISILHGTLVGELAGSCRYAIATINCLNMLLRGSCFRPRRHRVIQLHILMDRPSLPLLKGVAEGNILHTLSASLLVLPISQHRIVQSK
ncbi:hypothetical protein BO71DRAFT_182664 [Aspergillus ellipticus CBS 707.79]|uniref:Secreted protein n=1 Tax=Aspergillus ellipticus CBS 707.79 TaxID=1448320 RepID=A0A319DGH7_9EURO|nr:hypothetical protein BO71DRAFT_182664 [Aspergillus ellipticus CBS 707.79]